MESTRKSGTSTTTVCIIVPTWTGTFSSHAEKHQRKAVQTFSKECWLDMGMATITFTVHNDEQGRLIGDVCIPSRNQNSGLLTNFYQARRCFTQPWHCWLRFYRPK